MSAHSPVKNTTPIMSQDDFDSSVKYEKSYTKRQRDILDSTIPLQDVRGNEIAFIIRKAERLGDIETYEVASALFNKKMNPDGYYPQHTVAEARAILQSLTPWKINWGDEND